MNMLRSLLAFMAAALFGCGLLSSSWVKAQDYPGAVTELVAKTRAQVRTMDMSLFRYALDGKSDPGLIVDVREPAEYAGGHIPEAINIPRGQIGLKIWPHAGFAGNTDMDKRMTLYCGSGMRCILAAKSLQDLGFQNVIALDMRIADWKKAGYPLLRE